MAPWGATPRWYADLGLERDIDVLWMGKRGSKRRSNLLDQVRKELDTVGVSIYVADNEENPFIHGDDRIRFLNRAKLPLTSREHGTMIISPAFPCQFPTAPLLF